MFEGGNGVGCICKQGAEKLTVKRHSYQKRVPHADVWEKRNPDFKDGDQKTLRRVRD